MKEVKNENSLNTGEIIRSSSKALTVTSENFLDLRKQITDIYNQKIELARKLRPAKFKFYWLTIFHFISFIVVIGFFYKKISEARNSQQTVVKEIEKQISETYVKLSFIDKPQIEKSWLNCIDAFAELMESEKIWDLTYTENVDRVKARTIAETSVKRTLISNTERKITFIKSDLQCLFIPNANGPDLFILHF